MGYFKARDFHLSYPRQPRPFVEQFAEVNQMSFSEQKEVRG
jgi:hypothetical protein